MADDKRDRKASRLSVHSSWYERWSLHERMLSAQIDDLIDWERPLNRDNKDKTGTYVAAGEAIVDAGE
jgi:hypothetical protein